MFRERVSHALSKVLRHTANAEGIGIRADGFCSVRELLQLQVFKALSCSVTEIVDVVENSDKKRFQLSGESGELMVRAVQGHSMTNVEDALGLESLSDVTYLPDVCVHGTYSRNINSILERGLLAGGLPGASKRKHVHFQALEPGDPRVISGMRADCDAAIYIDLRAALRDGVPFFRSTNNVILSAGIEGIIAAKYIVQVATKGVPPPWLPSRPVKRERTTAHVLDGMKDDMGSFVDSKVFQCFSGHLDVRSLHTVLQCLDNSETVLAYPIVDWTEPRHHVRVSVDTPLRVHRMSEDGDFWLCSACCSSQRCMAWVPRDVMLVWHVREHCFQPDRGWQSADKFLPLSIHDTVVLRKRYSCGWEGWASGRTWGMRREADGVFPVSVLTPMVLVACDAACPKTLKSHVLPDPLQRENLSQCCSARDGHGVTDRLGVTAALADAHEVSASSSEMPSGWSHVQGYDTMCVHMLEASTPVTVEVSPGLCNGTGAETSATSLPLPGPLCFTSSGTPLFYL